MAGKFFNKNLQNILSPVHARVAPQARPPPPVHARAAETIDMQDVPILSFDFAMASEAHAAAKGHKRQKEDTMQEVPI